MAGMMSLSFSATSPVASTSRTMRARMWSGAAKNASSSGPGAGAAAVTPSHSALTCVRRHGQSGAPRISQVYTDGLPHGSAKAHAQVLQRARPGTAGASVRGPTQAMAAPRRPQTSRPCALLPSHAMTAATACSAAQRARAPSAGARAARRPRRQTAAAAWRPGSPAGGAHTPRAPRCHPRSARTAPTPVT